MAFTRLPLRCVAVLYASLAVLRRCVATEYRVAVAWPYDGTSYDSVFQGYTLRDDVSHSQGTDEIDLPVFPCGDSLMHSNTRTFVPLGDGMPLQVSQQTYDSFSTQSAQELVGDWSVDVFWGRFEGARFDPDGTNFFLWYPGMPRKYRVAGSGEWCRGGDPMPIPLSARPIGDSDGQSLSLNTTDLHDVNATLAIRFNYFDVERDPGDPDYDKLLHVTTECFHVQFTTTETPYQRFCIAPDNGVDTKEEAVAGSSVLASAVPSTVPSSTIVIKPQDPRPKTDMKFVGIGIGAVVGALILLHLYFRWARSRDKAACLEVQDPSSSEPNLPQSSRDSVMQGPAPAYQPRCPQSSLLRPVTPVSTRERPASFDNSRLRPTTRDGRLVAQINAAAEASGPISTSDHRALERLSASDDVEQWPPRYEPPPRYEDVAEQAPRRN